VKSAQSTDFQNPPANFVISEEGQEILASEERSFISYAISWDEMWKQLYDAGMIITWGYIEYYDIFGGRHTARHCGYFTFHYSGGKVAISHGVTILREDCNRRT
jgi:hypothetical protein